MIVIALIVLLALFAVGALLLWWRYDMDLSDIAASSVTPAIGIWLIYDYGTPVAWAGGLLLLVIGAFALAHLITRRERQASRRGHYRDGQQ